MATSIVVRSERGENVEWATTDLLLDDHTNLRAIAPIFEALDPYGNTIFNGRQCQMILDQVAHASVEGRELPAVLDEVTRLCTLVLARPHQYLWFVGD